MSGSLAAAPGYTQQLPRQHQLRRKPWFLLLESQWVTFPLEKNVPESDTPFRFRNQRYPQRVVKLTRRYSLMAASTERFAAESVRCGVSSEPTA
jgi:hypothetical protein